MQELARGNLSEWEVNPTRQRGLDRAKNNERGSKTKWQVYNAVLRSIAHHAEMNACSLKIWFINLGRKTISRTLEMNTQPT